MRENLFPLWCDADKELIFELFWLFSTFFFNFDFALLGGSRCQGKLFSEEPRRGIPNPLHTSFTFNLSLFDSLSLSLSLSFSLLLSLPSIISVAKWLTVGSRTRELSVERCAEETQEMIMGQSRGLQHEKTPFKSYTDSQTNKQTNKSKRWKTDL